MPTMLPVTRRLWAGRVMAVTTIAALAATSAVAQTLGLDPSGLTNAPEVTASPPPTAHRSKKGQTGDTTQQAALPALTPIKLPWPRLDAGAVFCRTAEDLSQHIAAVQARLDGAAAAEPPGCRMIAAMTGVTVLTRTGLAQTQVRVSGASGETGWTDAFLPAAGGAQ